jgi:hypothetical protein
LDQTHGKSYRRKSELYAIPSSFSLHEQQVSEFPVIFQGLFRGGISLRRSGQVRTSFVSADECRIEQDTSRAGR